MTTDTLTAEPTAPVLEVTAVRVVRSEWIKLRSLRSTVVTLVAALVVVIGLGVLATAVVGNGSGSGGPGGPGAGGFDPTDITLSGVTLGQIIVGVLGVLAITGEYSTGMIRSTFSAVPSRLPVLWAKVVVFGGVIFVISLVAAMAAFFIGQGVLGADGVTLGDDGVLRAVLGAALYMTGIGLLGLALGAILRHTAGAIGALVALILVLPTIAALLPGSWSEPLTKILPSNAGGVFMSAHPSSALLSPWVGLAVFVAWVVGALAVAAVLMRRRDA